jgi:glucose/arabinose dehydrogenase
MVPGLVCLLALLGGCTRGSGGLFADAAAATARQTGDAFVVSEVARFNEPWAMTFLPDGRLLVSEKRGALKIHTVGGGTADVKGVPPVAYGGQGGFGDVVLHPSYATNNLIYVSYAEPGDRGMRGAAVARAKLALDANGGGRLDDLQVIWRQEPKVSGSGHFGHRMAFGPDGFLYVTSGERQQFDPAQDLNSNLGKVVRLKEDGTPATGNPFASRGGVTAQIWSLGHRNLLGIAFDADGRLWTHEMGPRGGDELNVIERGANYGYPLVSNGDHYSGMPIPDHDTRPEFAAPKVWWNPVISPAGLIVYNGAMFPKWQGNALIGGLSSQSLVRVELDGVAAREAERFAMGGRIREVEQGPDGAIWLLEDGGRLLKLTPPGA